MGGVFGDKALAGDQLAHVFSGSRNQKTKVQQVEHVADDIDLEQDKASDNATEDLARKHRVLPSEHVAGRQGARGRRRRSSIGWLRFGRGAVEIKGLFWSGHGKKLEVEGLARRRTGGRE